MQMVTHLILILQLVIVIAVIQDGQFNIHAVRLRTADVFNVTIPLILLWHRIANVLLAMLLIALFVTLPICNHVHLAFQALFYRLVSAILLNGVHFVIKIMEVIAWTVLMVTIYRKIAMFVFHVLQLALIACQMEHVYPAWLGIIWIMELVLNVFLDVLNVQLMIIASASLSVYLWPIAIRILQFIMPILVMQVVICAQKIYLLLAYNARVGLHLTQLSVQVFVFHVKEIAHLVIPQILPNAILAIITHTIILIVTLAHTVLPLQAAWLALKVTLIIVHLAHLDHISAQVVLFIFVFLHALIIASLALHLKFVHHAKQVMD